MASEDENDDFVAIGSSELANNGLEEDFLSLGAINASTEDADEGDNATTDGGIGPQNNAYNRQSDLPPWMSHYVDYRRVNPLVSLHNEVVGFCKLMEPHPDEMKRREALVKDFKALVRSTFLGAQVDVFGSQATGLCLPTSDIDIAIQLSKEDTAMVEDSENADSKKMKTISKQQELEDMENWDSPTESPLHRLANALRENWLKDLSYLEVIENTRVPLVKFTHGPTDISVDVCFNQTTGVQAAKLMHQYMDALPPLRPLTFVLKYFMASRGLNQPYTGGVGSFMLQMMIVSFLQHRERESRHSRRPTNYNLGALLIEFFELYSMDFNFITVGVSVRFDGFYFPKGAADRKSDFWQSNRPFSFAMENALEPTMDVGAPSFRMPLVQRCFEIALKVLLSHVTEPLQPVVSILAAILPPTDEMKTRSTLLRLKPLSPTRKHFDTPNNSHRSPPRKRQRR